MIQQERKAYFFDERRPKRERRDTDLYQTIKDDILQRIDILEGWKDNEDGQVDWLSQEDVIGYEILLETLMEDLDSKMIDLSITRINVPMPKLGRDGVKLVWSNFDVFCTRTGCNPQYLCSYVANELCLTGVSLTGENQMRLGRSRFKSKQVMSVVKKFIGIYVVCGACFGVDTTLKKQNRIFMKECSCGSTKAVPPL